MKLYCAKFPKTQTLSNFECKTTNVSFKKRVDVVLPLLHVLKNATRLNVFLLDICRCFGAALFLLILLAASIAAG